MTLKTKMSLLVFLTSISIVSVGFSSWSITAETTAELNGNIKVDNVLELNNTASIVSSTAFEYFDTGFRNGDIISNTATISYNVSISIDECISTFTSRIIDVSILLKYKDGITSTLDMFDYLSTIKVNGTNVTSSTLKTYSVEFYKTYDISTYTEDILLSIEYTFNTSSTNFYEDIFPYLMNDNISFCMDLSLTEGGS